MSLDFPLVEEVRRLLLVGETVVTRVGVVELARLGLLNFDEVTGRCVVTRRIQRIVNGLPNDIEAIAAVFSCFPVLRAAWMRVVAARLRESGKRRDAAELFQAISTLDESSDPRRSMSLVIMFVRCCQ
jgi:hypothetical protein